MKKKLLLNGLLILILFIIVAGCENKNKNQNQNNTIIDNNTNSFELYNVTIELDSNRSLKKLNYKTNNLYFLPILMEDSGIRLEFDDYTKKIDISGGINIYIRYYENEDIDTLMSNVPYKRTKKKINDLEYEYYEYDNNGIKGYCYLYNYEGITYIVSFESNINIDSLINSFMKNVSFK